MPTIILFHFKLCAQKKRSMEYSHNTPAPHLGKARGRKPVDIDDVSATTAVFPERKLAQSSTVFNLLYNIYYYYFLYSR